MRERLLSYGDNTAILYDSQPVQCSTRRRSRRAAFCIVWTVHRPSIGREVSRLGFFQ
jgi:hypothetical protein